MRLQSRDRHAEVADFDPSEGRLTTVERDQAGSLLDQPLGGHFANLAGKLVAFYRAGGDLWIRAEGRSTRISDPAQVRWERTADGLSRLRVDDEEGGRVHDLSYQPGPHSGPPLEEDPTPFVEHEDWDFGLFITNVLADPGRRERIYSS